MESSIASTSDETRRADVAPRSGCGPFTGGLTICRQTKRQPVDHVQENRYEDHRAWYVLGLLFAAYTLSFLDRQILSILFQPIKLEMDLSDTQLGLLGGIALALFYATLGLPLAMLADRSNRVRIVTGSLVVFSTMTAACGVAQNFWQLFLARIGVGVGEAGVNPSSHSIIADIFPHERRSTAMGVLATGANVGQLLGLVIGGVLSTYYGWRVAIVAVGLPGLLLAVVFRLTVTEPQRGASEGRAASGSAPPLKESLLYMWRNQAMRHLIIGSMLKGTAGYGVGSWLPSLFIRSHGLTGAQVGLLLGLLSGILGGTGALLGGYLNDRLSKREAGNGLAFIALATAGVYPLAVGAYLSGDLRLAVALILIPVFVNNMFLAPSLALVQSLARVRMRAVASAVKMLTLNLVGLGLGPFAVGFFSDSLQSSFGERSLGIAMSIVASSGVWGALHFYISSRHMEAGLQMAAEDETQT